MNILELVNLIQPQDPWTEEHYKWQHDNSKLYMKFNHNLLISLYIAVKKRLRVQSDIKKAFMVQDVMTHPNFRNQGYSNQLAAQCTHDIVKGNYFSYTFPNKLSEGNFRHNKWTELSKVPLRTMLINKCAYDGGIKMIRVNQFDNIATNIWCNSDLKIGVHREATFLNWRYSRPKTKYHKFLIDNKGYLVLKQFGNKLHLLDLVVHKDSRDKIRSILQFTKLFASTIGADILTCWLFDTHPYAEEFNQIGLTLDKNHDRSVFVMAPDLNTFTNTNLWHLTQGDSDIY